MKIVPVLSQPDDSWTKERGYVQVKCVGIRFSHDYLHRVYVFTHYSPSQAAFNKAKQISNPLSTGAVLCGQKQMAEVRTIDLKSALIVSQHNYETYFVIFGFY